MVPWIRRPRLLDQLRRRHRVRLVVLDSPAGYGRSVLLDQALAEGTGPDRDVLYRCGPDDDRPGQLAAGLLAACGALLPVPEEGPPGPREELAEPGSAAVVVAAALDRLAAKGQVALVVDDAERAGPAGDGLWAALLDRMGANTHLVLSGRRLSPAGLARLVVAGRAVRLDAGDLAFSPEEVEELVEAVGPPAAALRTDADLASWPALAALVAGGQPDLVDDYLVDNVLDGLDPLEARALSALSAVDGCPGDLLHRFLAEACASDPPEQLDPDLVEPGLVEPGLVELVADRLRQLPLVRSTGGGCWPHPVWKAAARDLDGDRRSRVVVAKVRALAAAGAVAEAGQLAMATRDGRALATVVRAALATQPAKASVADRRAWANSALLPAGSVEGTWLAAVLSVEVGEVNDGLAELELVRKSFEMTDDDGGETAVLLHLGVLARARNDLGELMRLLERAGELAAQGNAVAAGLVALGRAVGAQMSDDPEGALAALDAAPPGSLVGDWAAQALMVRGINLLLAGHIPAAVTALRAATGDGSGATRAAGHDLLATALWYAGDRPGALVEARRAVDLATLSSPPAFVRQVRAALSCLLAATGQRDEAAAELARARRGPAEEGDEAAALLRMAEILLVVDTTPEAARRLLHQTPTPGRSIRSSVWKVALQTALDGHPSPDLQAAADKDLAFSRAAAAGRAAAAAAAGAGGPPVEAEHRPYLPAAWCRVRPPVLELALIGGGQVRRDFAPVDPPAWGRARVRELCLHLVLVADRDRAAVAAALWPDRSDRAAGQNLRVTLTHLLDVLDPDRPRSGGSPLLVDGEGALTFRRHAELRVDLWVAEAHARGVLETPAHERLTLLAHARRLVEGDSGPLLGGAATGEWLEPHRRRFEELVVTAALVAGSHALAAADDDLAEALGRRALAVDQWSEQAHRLVVEARLAGGDVDGARRGLFQAAAALGELGMNPGSDLVALAYRAGIAGRTPTSLGAPASWPGPGLPR